MKNCIYFVIKKTNRLVLLALMSFVFLFACNETPQKDVDKETAEVPESKPVQIIIEAESFTSTEGEMKVETMDETVKYVVTPSTDSWLAFDVNVPVAGRYKYEQIMLVPGWKIMLIIKMVEPITLPAQYPFQPQMLRHLVLRPKMEVP